MKRVGIAGYGVVGKRRRVHIDETGSLHTVAVCDQTITESGTVRDGVRAYSNYQELLAHEQLDALFISLPNYLAPEVTVAALERGLHVFCEKPPGRTVEDIQRVIDVERKSGLVLKYGFNHRYHDSVLEGLRLMHSGTLGEIINLRGVYGKSTIVPFEGSWRARREHAGGGILLDQGIHMVDLIRLFGGEFRDVKSFVSNGHWKEDVEDNAYALMRGEKGRIAILHSSATQWQHRFSLEIAMTEGYIVLQGILSSSKSYGQERLIVGHRSQSPAGTAHEEVFTFLEDHSWHDEVAEFARAITDGDPLACGTSADALETMRLVTRIYFADPDWRDQWSIPCPS